MMTLKIMFINLGEFIKETISDRQYTNEPITNYISEIFPPVEYPNPKNIPHYPIDPYNWINKVSLNNDKEGSI